MLRVSFPHSWGPERSWVASVVLGEFLGLDYQPGAGGAGGTRISAAGRTLELADDFFAGNARAPARPQRWTPAESGLDPRLCAPDVPVLYGAPGFRIDAAGNAVLGLDVFGSAFFMLSRHEETTNPERDEHGRFPAAASAAVRWNFLDRPVVDEYVEILWSAMQRLWPRLERKQRKARTLVSCDVDLPFDPACASLRRLGKRLLGRAWRERSLASLPATVGNYCAVRRGDQGRDPYLAALSWMMDVNEAAGNQVTFNFIPEPTDRERDNAPVLHEPRMRALLRTVHRRGHLVGLHPGYNTYRHPGAFARSVAILRRAMDEEGIAQDQLGGRQHYLRWDAGATPRLWADNGLAYDSTLCYATRPGFRAGTCHEYTMYDLAARRPLALAQRPLVVMEHTVIDAAGMGPGDGERALAAMQHYRHTCRRFDGDFTLLWHNSSFDNDAARATYRALLH